MSPAVGAWPNPLIKVDGHLADIFVSSDPAMLLKATGPIGMVITSHVGSKGIVTLTNLGFLKGYKIRFKQSSALRTTTSHT